MVLVTTICISVQRVRFSWVSSVEWVYIKPALLWAINQNQFLVSSFLGLLATIRLSSRSWILHLPESERDHFGFFFSCMVQNIMLWCLAFWSLNQLCKSNGWLVLHIYRSGERQEKPIGGAPLVRVYSLLVLSLFLPLIVSLKCSSSCSLKWRGNLRDEALNPCRASSKDYGFLTSNNLVPFSTSCSAKVSVFCSLWGFFHLTGEWMVESWRVWLPSTWPYFTFRYYELCRLWLTKSLNHDKNKWQGRAKR